MAGVTKDGGAGLGPHEIYEKITNGPGPDRLQEARNATQLEAQAEAERTTLITDLTKMIGNGWEGSASEAAYDVTKPLIDTGQQRTEHLGNAGGYLQDQLAAFADVKNRVRPVAATPPPTNVLVEAEPWLADLDHATQNFQNDSQNNIAAFTAYDSASQTNGQQLPREYPVLKDPGSSPEVVLSGTQDAGGTSADTANGTTHSHGGTGVPSVPGGSGATHSSGQSTPPPGGHPITQGPQVAPGSTSASSATPPPVYQPGSSGYPQAPAARGPSTGAPAESFGPYGGTGYGPGGGSGRGAGYGSGSGYSGGSSGGSGSGAGARTGGSPESGARSGAGALPAEEAMARRAAGTGTAARGGAGGMGMGAGHGGSREEDAEHERPSFLQENDPEDLFGTDEVTAPPVIE